MTDPYRPPDAPMARRPDAPPMWESFVTWGVALVSICLSVLVWATVLVVVLHKAGSGVETRLMDIRPLSMLLLFSLPFPAGIALLMSRPASVVFYAVFTLGVFVAFVLIGEDSSLLMVTTCALIFTMWVFVLWRRGRFRRI